MARMELAPWMGKQQAPAKTKAAGKKKAPPFGKQAVGSGASEKAKPGAKTVTIKAKADMDGDYKKVGSGGDTIGAKVTGSEGRGRKIIVGTPTTGAMAYDSGDGNAERFVKKAVGSGGDAAKCPQCGKTTVGGVCPACGYTAKKVGSGGDNPLMPDPKLTAANAASSGGRQIRQGAGNWAITVPEAMPKPEISFNKGKRPGVGQAGKPAVGKFGRRKAGSSKSGIAD